MGPRFTLSLRKGQGGTCGLSLSCTLTRFVFWGLCAEHLDSRLASLVAICLLRVALSLSAESKPPQSYKRSLRAEHEDFRDSSPGACLNYQTGDAVCTRVVCGVAEHGNRLQEGWKLDETAPTHPVRCTRMHQDTILLLVDCA